MAHQRGNHMEEAPRSLFKVECVPDCGFMVRSHDREELVNAATHHTKRIHNQDVPQAEIENMIQPA